MHWLLVDSIWSVFLLDSHRYHHSRSSDLVKTVVSYRFELGSLSGTPTQNTHQLRLIVITFIIVCHSYWGVMFQNLQTWMSSLLMRTLHQIFTFVFRNGPEVKFRFCKLVCCQRGRSLPLNHRVSCLLKQWCLIDKGLVSVLGSLNHRGTSFHQTTCR